jgi:two-component system, NtrC family, sensor kinase
LDEKASPRSPGRNKPTREALAAALAESQRELAEARRRENATAEVLRIIGRSAFDLHSVLETLLKSAVELCGADHGAIFLRDGEVMRLRVQRGYPAEFVELLRMNPIRAGRETFTGRVVLTGDAVHVPDVLADPEYSFGEGPRLGKYRAAVSVPLLRDRRVEGVFTLTRPDPGAFPERQIEMVRAFADQAMIAIENARLFNEVQAKTRDLEESLQQQTATADVLKVISRSAFDLQTVFDTLLSSAATLCGAIAGNLWVRDREVLRHKASFGLNPDFRKFLAEYPQRPSREMMAGRVFLERGLACR